MSDTPDDRTLGTTNPDVAFSAVFDFDTHAINFGKAPGTPDLDPSTEQIGVIAFSLTSATHPRGKRLTILGTSTGPEGSPSEHLVNMAAQTLKGLVNQANAPGPSPNLRRLDAMRRGKGRAH